MPAPRIGLAHDVDARGAAVKLSWNARLRGLVGRIGVDPEYRGPLASTLRLGLRVAAALEVRSARVVE